MRYKVLRDNREQANNGWFFDEGGECVGTAFATIKTGDYTLEGYEGILTIERKGTTGEFATNVNEARFTRELERMNLMKYPYLILEFELADLYNFPANSGIPKSKWPHLRVSANYLLKRLTQIYNRYPNIRVLFAGQHGPDIAVTIFRNVLEDEEKTKYIV